MATDQNRSGIVRLMFGGKRRTFRLAIGELRELQQECDAGPREIVTRLAQGRERIDDIVETLRLGLIGGGLDPDKAGDLVNRYGPEGRPMIESVPVAQAILLAAIMGAPEEEVGKKKRMPGWRSKTPSPDTKSDLATSTPLASLSAEASPIPATSTN